MHRAAADGDIQKDCCYWCATSQRGELQKPKSNQILGALRCIMMPTYWRVLEQRAHVRAMVYNKTAIHTTINKL